MAANEKRIDWLRVVVHGVVGALFGTALGFGYWIFTSPESSPWPIVALVAVVVAVLAALFGDRFWRSLGESTWWGPGGSR
jgi:hypothetical protein